MPDRTVLVGCILFLLPVEISGYTRKKAVFRVRRLPALHFKNYQNGEPKRMDIKYIIAENVRLYRKKEKLTQVQLAERAELSPDSVKRIEKGKITVSLESFLRLAEALGVPVAYLISEKIEELPEMQQLHEIVRGKSEKQKRFLLHMLRQMAEEMEKL